MDDQNTRKIDSLLQEGNERDAIMVILSIAGKRYRDLDLASLIAALKLARIIEETRDLLHDVAAIVQECKQIVDLNDEETRMLSESLNHTIKAVSRCSP